MLSSVEIIAESGVSQEITKFLQGYIDNEVNLSPDGSCTMTCSDYQNTRHHECRPDTLCAAMKPHHQKIVSCKGKVRGCHALDDELDVCPSVCVAISFAANCIN